MRIEIEIPEPPEGSSEPTWGLVYLPIDPRMLILVDGNVWGSAEHYIKTGGSRYIYCFRGDKSTTHKEERG